MGYMQFITRMTSFFYFLEFSHCQKRLKKIKGLSAPHSNRLLMHTWSTEIIQKYFHHEVYFEDFGLGVQACVCVHVKHGPFDGFIIFNGLGTPSDMGKFFPAIHQTIDAGWNPIAPSIGSQFQSECAVRTSVFLFLK